MSDLDQRHIRRLVHEDKMKPQTEAGRALLVNEPHPVYPEGPPCNPHCPGSWSQYHDGYADGYERGKAAAVERWLASPETERRLADWLWRKGRGIEVPGLYKLTTTTRQTVIDHYERQAREALAALRENPAQVTNAQLRQEYTPRPLRENPDAEPTLGQRIAAHAADDIRAHLERENHDISTD